MTESLVQTSPAPFRLQRWRSERALRLIVVLAAIGIWIALAVSMIGIAYVALLGVFFFVTHIGFITHLRGNAVRLGPRQMPELYERVRAIAGELGLRTVPDAYLVQAGGALNALATKFLRTNFIVLFSDLLEACGDNTQARDFIIAHELGHLRAGHLRWRWFLLPGLFVPFLGTAYSRACEYTSDRCGASVTGNSAAALEGLCILAAGGRHARDVDQRTLAAQREDLNTAWMKIGRWLGTHVGLDAGWPARARSAERSADPTPDAIQLASPSIHRGLPIPGIDVLLRDSAQVKAELLALSLMAKLPGVSRPLAGSL